ncbi:MAG: hypothetical protein LH618_16990 [Saprospiraceae bacterium]|nr:hypothetical protein [Saprospiraceae bacterium]
MEIKCSYTLQPFTKDLIGSKLSSIAFKKGTVFFEDDIFTFSGIFDFLISFHDGNLPKPITYQVSPKGMESLGGDIFGFELTEYLDGRYDLGGFNVSHMFNDLQNEVKAITGYGEIETKLIDDKDLLTLWYERSDYIPDSLTVNKSTLDLIAIEFMQGKTMFIRAGGEGYYVVFFDTRYTPDEFIEKNFNDKELKIITKID